MGLYQNVSPGKDHWLSASSGLAGLAYNMIFGKSEVRVEVYISRPEAEPNKAIFDALQARQAEIETAFGKALVWQRLDDKKACRIKCAKEFDGYNRENWPEMIDWLVEHVALMEKTFRPQLGAVKRGLKG